MIFFACACSVMFPPASRSLAQVQISEIDDAIAEYMALTGATSGSVALNYDGNLIYSRGLGFSDSQQRVPTRAGVCMRLASCTKPVTRAAVMRLIEKKQLSFETRVFDYLAIKPLDDLPQVDQRIGNITIRHLLKHQGGWDREATFDPVFDIDRVREGLGLVSQPDKRQIVRYMWGQPLQFEPGADAKYSNFGFVLLGLVIEKASGVSFVEAVRHEIGEPLGIDDLGLSSNHRRFRHPREVYYPREGGHDLRLQDAAAGLVTSAPSLCKIMSAYWMDGVRRNRPRNVYFYQVGTHPFTTTTIMEQRLDGIDYAIMLNSRRNEHHGEDDQEIRRSFNAVLDSIKSDVIDGMD